MYIKNFLDWFKLKPRLDSTQSRPTFREGEIWWCHLGGNVGFEESGKGDKYLRPVLVIKKFNGRLFYGIPTTSKVKDNRFYLSLTVKQKEVCLILSQIRSFDANRLYYKQAKISENELKIIRKRVSNIFFG